MSCEPKAPPEGYRPGKDAAWCSYCCGERPFAYDGYLNLVRCSGCGVSTEDFYVRKHNGFFAYAEDGKKRTSKGRFEEAVKASGRRWQRERKGTTPDRAAETGLPLWDPPDGASGPEPLYCPECGVYVRHGYYPAVNLRCASCGAVFSQEGPGAPARTARRDGHYCPRCGALLARVCEEDAAYWCPDCSTWSTPGAGKKAMKALDEARAEAGRLKVYRKGPLPGPVLEKARQLAAAECTNFESKSCLVLDGPCVFASADGEHRCRWFEEAVLPPDPALREAYVRPYGEGAADKEGREALQQARKALEKPCSRCGKPFVPRNNFDRYCSDICRREARKEGVKAAVKNYRQKSGT